jgi:integrase/recombinase XerD
MATPSTDASRFAASPAHAAQHAHAAFGSHTKQDYVRHVRCFAAFLGRLRDTATPDDIRHFQLDQHENSVEPATINGTVSALRFLFVGMPSSHVELKLAVGYPLRPTLMTALIRPDL